ncbi:MAG: glycerol-3-phosphate acyltransferase [Marinilabiliales bacterium]|nr:glycerol-3-phosphate acyltransferase [Marinilabiliales bacterium]
MNTLLAIASFILAYLLGSVPTAVWAGKIFRGIDLREHGKWKRGSSHYQGAGMEDRCSCSDRRYGQRMAFSDAACFIQSGRTGVSALITNLQIGTGL